jgi:transcriptional regulator with PAS, ATPase and Fis domain
MDLFGRYSISELIQLISEACLKWNYTRSSDLQYLREFASQNFFPIGEHQNISSVQLKCEHDKYRQAMTKLLDICPELFQILNNWCKENEQRELLITDEMKKDQQTRYQDITTKLKQQECAVMVFGDTGAGKNNVVFGQRIHNFSKTHIFLVKLCLLSSLKLL